MGEKALRRAVSRYQHSVARIILIGALASAATPCAAAANAPAKTEIAFSIPAQSLERALLSFAKAANVQLAMNSTELDGMTAPALVGRYTPAEALRRLLRTQNLGYQWTGPNTVAIKRVPAIRPIAQRLDAMPDASLPAGSSDRAPVAPANEQQVEDIIVTAQKREENLQKVPISVAAFGAGELSARGLTDVKQLSVAVPGLQIPELSGIVMPFIRGVGSATNTLANESSVAIYLDGVYFARLPSGLLDLNNMSRVEVLKGPQGTLFGRNSTGGVINIVTADPSHETAVKGSLGYGRFNAFQGNLYATTGLSDTVAVDISVSGKTDSGFGRNLSNGSRYGYQDQFLVRSKLLFEPSAMTKFTLSGFYSWTHQDGNKGFFPGTTVRTFDNPPQVFSGANLNYYDNLTPVDDIKFKDWGVSLRAEQELPFARLTSITAYTHSGEPNTTYDIDRTSLDEFTIHTSGYAKVFSQELQLSSLPHSPVSWVLGAFYYNNLARYTGMDFISQLLFGPGFSVPAQQHSLSYATFAQATYEILPRLRLTGGVRYTHEKTSASGQMFINTTPPTPAPGAPPGQTTEDRVTFKASADYQVTDNVMLYGSFSRGFKSGNFSIFIYGSDVPTKPETLDAFEAGMKGEFLDKRVRLNLAAFRYTLGQPQVQLLINNNVAYSNGGGARMQGIEAEGQAVLFPGFNARFNALYLDAKYTDYKNAPANTADPVGGGVLALPAIDAAGHRTPYAAKFTFGLGGDYTITTSKGVLTLTADYYHNSGYFFEPDNFLYQPAYGLLSGQIKFAPSDNLAVRIWGKNLTDSQYAQLAVTAGPAAFIYRPAEPRTYGIAVDFKF